MLFSPNQVKIQLKMRMKRNTNIKFVTILVSIIVLFFLIGCVTTNKYNLALEKIARMRVDSATQANELATLRYEKVNELTQLNNQLQIKSSKVDSLEKFALMKKRDFDQLSSDLQDIIPNYNENKLESYLDDGYLHISLPGRILFNRGEDQLTTDGARIVQEISNKLKDTKVDIMILGHTDSLPYISSKKDNWQLSFDRSHSVMDLMVKNGVNADQIIVAGRGKYDTALSNNTQIGQLLNRRIELVLMPDMDKLENIFETYFY